MFIEHPSGAEPYRWRSAPALAFCRAIALCRTLALCRALAFESRVHVRETASVRIYFKGGTDRYTPWGARGVPVAALGFLKARKDTGNGHSAHTGTHTRDREQRLTPPPTRRAPVVAGELQRANLRGRHASGRLHATRHNPCQLRQGQSDRIGPARE